MKVHQIVNNFHLSNTYVLELNQNKVVLVDVGNVDQINHWLDLHQKEVVAVILTHEHSDHCHGLNELYSTAKFALYCTENCSINIKNSKQNFSRYIDEIKTFEVAIEDTQVIRDLESIELLGTSFQFIATPGHSPGSMCIRVADKLFTGDTVLNGIKTPLNLPHSNKDDYQRSIEKLKKYITVGITIYPGHDQPFIFKGGELI